MAGRKGMPRATSVELDARLERALGWRAAGLSFVEIGRREGVGANAIANLLRRREADGSFERVCGLVECDITFITTDPGAKYCSPLHSKRGNERTRNGKVTRYMPCRLPECDEQVLCVDVNNPGKKFCCKTHGARHLNRLEIGYYEKLIERHACSVCGFWGPGLERHHIKPQHKGGSDHPNNLVWLCWNHHRLIHSGLATINHRRVFVDMREQMRGRELACREAWGEE